MGFLKLPGSYEDWNVYKKSVIICDVTEIFINRALPKNSRTIDQMRQSARSCKQNIVEGCSDKAISAEMCIKLIGVAKGSIRELKEDYRDFLRQHQLETWAKNDSRTIRHAIIAKLMMTLLTLPKSAVNVPMKLLPISCSRR